MSIEHTEPHSVSAADERASTPPSGGSPAPVAWAQAAAVRLSQSTINNPVLVKEFRTRMRGSRAYWMLLGYTLLLAGVLAMMYFAFEADRATRVDAWQAGSSGRATGDLGRAMYYFTFIAQALMVGLITPALTAGAVTIEREQRSYELLVTTPLRSIDLIRGKLTAAVSFVVLLLTASLPLVSISFLAGGVSPSEIFFSYLLIALSAFVYGSLGIFWSAALRTTAAATVVTYLTVLTLGIVTIIPGTPAMNFGAGTNIPEIPFKSLNPVTATLSAVKPEYFFHLQIPGWISAATVNLLLALVIANAAMARLEHFEPPKAFWTRFLSTLLWCSFTLFLFGAFVGAMASSWTGTNPQPGMLLGLYCVVLVLIVVVTPVFNTGDLIVRRGESALGRYFRGLLPSRMFHADLSCGVPLVMAWLAFVFAALGIGMAITGKWTLFSNTASYLPAIVLSACVVFGLAGLGNILSVTLPSRWAACVLTYLAAVVLLLLPYLALLPYNSMAPAARKGGPLWQVLYFVPFEGLRQVTDPAIYRTSAPALIFDKLLPVWVVTSAIYLGLGAFCFFLTLLRIRSADRRLQEEMAARELAYQAAVP